MISDDRKALHSPDRFNPMFGLRCRYSFTSNRFFAKMRSSLFVALFSGRWWWCKGSTGIPSPKFRSGWLTIPWARKITKSVWAKNIVLSGDGEWVQLFETFYQYRISGFGFRFGTFCGRLIAPQRLWMTRKYVLQWMRNRFSSNCRPSRTFSHFWFTIVIASWPR